MPIDVVNHDGSPKAKEFLELANMADEIESAVVVFTDKQTGELHVWRMNDSKEAVITRLRGAADLLQRDLYPGT